MEIDCINSAEPRFTHIRAIRNSVFVQEQGVSPANEFDETDWEALHFLIWRGGEPIGTARLYGEGGVARIGRVAVLASARGQGAGRALMEKALAEARRLGYSEVVIHAQTRVRAFYERLGFDVEGEMYEEEGIPHVSMRRVYQVFASDDGV